MNDKDLTDGSRVHFRAEELPEHDSKIVIKTESDSCLSVHLGFLQVHHHYEIKFSIKDNLGEDVISDPVQNIHCRILEARPSEDGEGHDLTVDFSAHKEKLQREQLIIRDIKDATQSVTLTLHARVLGKGKGTPSLREGIHCTGIDLDEDSEQSDWQGFE